MAPKRRPKAKAKIAKRPKQVFTVKPRTAEFADKLATGRVGLYGIDIGQHTAALFCIVCGWTGGLDNSCNASRTNAILRCCRAEAKCHKDYLVGICGDINAGPDNLTELGLILAEDHWIDVGAVASIFGGIDEQATC